MKIIHRPDLDKKKEDEKRSNNQPKSQVNEEE
jgi:hypothetical protein